MSDPQYGWGLAVLDRLALAGDERVLDLGCGTGRVTRVLADRLPAGFVVAADLSPAMLDAARAKLGDLAEDRYAIVRCDATRLPLIAAFDVIFSTATFHWVRDHEALFAALFDALRPGGRLHAQCGGGPNLSALRAAAAALMRDPRFAPHFHGWTEPWNYADAETTRQRLKQAGFTDVQCRLREAPTHLGTVEIYREFIRTVNLRPYLTRLPSEALRDDFVDEMTARGANTDPALTLDYWRLDLEGRRPA